MVGKALERLLIMFVIQNAPGEDVDQQDALTLKYRVVYQIGKVNLRLQR